MAKASKPTHLAASMRVLASHLHMRRLTIDITRDEVLKAAHLPQTATEAKTLVARLEKVTGVGIAEVAKGAGGWRGA